MDIIPFYSGLLKSTGLSIDDNAGVFINTLDVSKPLTIDGKQLVLPTKAILKESPWETKIGFHPACESVIRKESIVLKRLRDIINAKLTYVTSELLAQLMDIAVDNSKHALLGPEQSEVLSLVANVDGKTSTALTKVLNAISSTGENKLINLYIKRSGGKLGKTDYRRLAVVTFPILAHADVPESTIFGVKIRKADKEAILSLFEYILPGSKEPEKYWGGSNDMTAPNFHVLCLTYANLMENLNRTIQLFRDFLDNADALYGDLDWVDGVEKLARYRAAVPALDGNDGEPLSDANNRSVATVLDDEEEVYTEAEPVKRAKATPNYEERPRVESRPVQMEQRREMAPVQSGEPQKPSWNSKLNQPQPGYHDPYNPYGHAPQPQYHHDPRSMAPPNQHYMPPPVGHYNTGYQASYQGGYGAAGPDSPGRARTNAMRTNQHYDTRGPYRSQW